jgi:acetylornithine/N-succinyldiaminopimelate aminotransferase
MIPTVLPTYNRAPLAFVRGSGSWLWSEDGERYLDLGAGIAVNALGHAHPEELAALLVNQTFADTVFFTNSGTETAELAVKMARKYWYEKAQPERVEIISFEGAFHGRSSAAIAAAPTEKMVKGFGPLLPGFVTLPLEDVGRLRAAVSDRTAAILIEPIQGEGGIRVVSDSFLRELEAIRDATGVLLIFDEVQCGMGRTGRLFAHEWSGVRPDIMMVAKGWRQSAGLRDRHHRNAHHLAAAVSGRCLTQGRAFPPGAGGADRLASRDFRGGARRGADPGTGMQGSEYRCRQSRLYAGPADGCRLG